MAVAVSSSSRATEEADLVKAAKAEGEVTLYSAATENVAKRVADAFRKKYGIEVRFIRLGSSPLLQRFSTEAEAGTFVADVIFTAGGAQEFVKEAKAKGWVQSIDYAELPVVQSGEFPKKDNRGLTALAQTQLWIIAYNTDLVKESEKPASWEALLDPKFQGQIIIPDPAVSDAYTEFWALLEKEYGADFLRKVAQTRPRRFDSGVAALQSLSAGEAALLIPMTVPAVNSLKAKGAPAASLTPALTTGVEMQVIMPNSRKVPHPNAGKLLANFMLSKEGNAILNSEDGSVSVYNESGLPARYESPDPGAAKRTSEIRQRLGF